MPKIAFAMTHTYRVDQIAEIETPSSLEELGEKIANLARLLAARGYRIVSASHSYNPDAPADSRHSVLIMAATEPQRVSSADPG